MSKIKTIIEVDFPEHTSRKEEEYVLRELTCPKCKGAKYLPRKAYGRDEGPDPCDYCETAGRLKAVIIIQFIPELPVEEIRQSQKRFSGFNPRPNQHKK